MLITEWNMDDALAVRYAEGLEEGLEKTAKNALAEGMPVEVIHKITGLDMETITGLQAQ